MERRKFIKNVATSSVALATITSLKTNLVFADNHTSIEKKAKELTAAIKSAQAGAFKIKAPNVAENGAVVPVTLDASKMDGVEEVSILVPGNPGQPLAVSFSTMNDSKAYISTRIKMGKTSPVVFLVKTNNGKYYKKEKEVKVTIGGCGG